MSEESIRSCAMIMEIPLKDDMDPRKFTEVFLEGFVGHTILQRLQSLVKCLRENQKFPCLSDLTHELEWLTYKTYLKGKAFELCGEVEMSTFPEYVLEKLPNETCHLKLNQYPDMRSKLTCLIEIILQSPKNYNVLKTFCQQTDALKKYVSLDFEIRAEVMPYVSVFVFSIPITLHLLED